ncbi:MAG: DUF3750 domain-containing protein [Alphaproteobacteria bacterium]|nr:DUF3750 domain-containing protein [Alphaproteobacteria bacterium]
MQFLTISLAFFAMLFVLSACNRPDWRTADRSSAGLAPSPQIERDAIVHVYSARAFDWRGYFAVHSWIATKEKDAEFYTTYHVMGFNLRRNLSVVDVKQDVPDRAWYGAKPSLVAELKGARAEAAIPKIAAAAKSYPYPMSYRVWPGPNSNTFISHILRNTPEIGVELPSNAIGKDWINHGKVFARSESGTGVQLSLFGVLGCTVGLGEGVEVNVLGLNFGVDVLRPAFKLPFVGRVGMRDKPAS